MCSPFNSFRQCASETCVMFSFDSQYDKLVFAGSQPTWGLCTKNEHCIGHQKSSTVCNIPRGSVGHRAPVSYLLTSDEVSCDPLSGLDMYDARRGLYCRSASSVNVGYVCTQRAGNADTGIGQSYCTPNVNPRLSRCRPTAGISVECRAGDDLSSAACGPLTEIMEQCRVCNSGQLNVQCVDGLACSVTAVVDRVQPFGGQSEWRTVPGWWERRDL